MTGGWWCKFATRVTIPIPIPTKRVSVLPSHDDRKFYSGIVFYSCKSTSIHKTPATFSPTLQILTSMHAMQLMLLVVMIHLKLAALHIIVPNTGAVPNKYIPIVLPSWQNLHSPVSDKTGMRGTLPHPCELQL